jgi:hypothetical protein
MRPPARRIHRAVALSCLIFALNAWICRELFTADFVNNLLSNEGIFAALGRFFPRAPHRSALVPLVQRRHGHRVRLSAAVARHDSRHRSDHGMAGIALAPRGPRIRILLRSGHAVLAGLGLVGIHRPQPFRRARLHPDVARGDAGSRLANRLGCPLGRTASE